MKWNKLNESYGYTDLATSEFERRMDKEYEIADITDSLDKDTVCKRYLDYNEDIPEHEWIIDLWYDMYNRGLIEFENYVYDGDEWLEEPNASIELGDDCLWGSLKGLESNPKWKSKIEDYIQKNPEYELYTSGDRFFIVNRSSDGEENVSESDAIIGSGTIQTPEDIVKVYTPTGKEEYIGTWEECPYYHEDLEYSSLTKSYKWYNPDDEDDYRIIICVD